MTGLETPKCQILRQLNHILTVESENLADIRDACQSIIVFKNFRISWMNWMEKLQILRQLEPKVNRQRMHHQTAKVYKIIYINRFL